MKQKKMKPFCNITPLAAIRNNYVFGLKPKKKKQTKKTSRFNNFVN